MDKSAADAAHEQVRARERGRGERHEPDEGRERDGEDGDRGYDDGDGGERRDDQEEEHDPEGTIFGRLPAGDTLIGRWVSVEEPSRDVLASMQREFERAAGRFAPEPEEPTPAQTGAAAERR